ncbi:hypothetical protein [Arcticibacter tournemirensis]
MKVVHFFFLLAAVFLCACQSNTSKSKVVSADSVHSDELNKGAFIQPGKSAGKISLGQDMPAVGNLLGEPDAGDAAMGKAWGIWYDKDSTAGERSEIAIYSSYADSTMMVKNVKQIRVTNDTFKTKEGLGTGSSLADFKAVYPDMEPRSEYLHTASGDTLRVYDSKSKGLATEIIRGTCTAITIHPSGVYANETYFTLDTNWKQIK